MKAKERLSILLAGVVMAVDHLEAKEDSTEPWAGSGSEDASLLTNGTLAEEGGVLQQVAT